MSSSLFWILLLLSLFALCYFLSEPIKEKEVLLTVNTPIYCWIVELGADGGFCIFLRMAKLLF